MSGSRGLHVYSEGKRFAVAYQDGTDDRDANAKRKPSLVILCCDTSQLRPFARIRLHKDDAIACVTPDGDRIAVLRTHMGTTATHDERTFDVFIYDLTTGTLASSFSLGSAFDQSLPNDRDRNYGRGQFPHPTLSFSRDSTSLFAEAHKGESYRERIPFEPPSVSRDAGSSRQEEDTLRVGQWDAGTGELLTIIQRRARSRELRPDHTRDLSDLVATASVIAEGHRLKAEGLLRKAQEKYLEAMPHRQEWFFRDQYPSMLSTVVDVLAEDGKENNAREILAFMTSAGLPVTVNTDAAAHLVEKLAEEEAARVEAERIAVAEARRKAEAKEKQRRVANKARHKPAATMTKKQFLALLDDTKDRGVMNPAATHLIFERFVFEDVIGDPDKTLSIKQGESEYGYQCKDGAVWLTVTGVPGTGITIVTGVEMR